MWLFSTKWRPTDKVLSGECSGPVRNTSETNLSSGSPASVRGDICSRSSIGSVLLSRLNRVQQPARNPKGAVLQKLIARHAERKKLYENPFPSAIQSGLAGLMVFTAAGKP